MKTKLTKLLGMFILAFLVILALGTCQGPAAHAGYGDCLAYDSFNRTNGNPGSTETIGPYGVICPALPWAMSSSNWQISSNKVINNLGLGAELLTNSSFTAWTGNNPDGWTVTGESGTDPEISEVGTGQSHGGVGNGLANLYTTGTLVYIHQTPITVGTWYVGSLTLDTSVAGSVSISNASGTTYVGAYSALGKKTFVLVGVANNKFVIQRGTGGTNNITFDNVSLKSFVLPDALSTINLSTPNVVAKVEIVPNAGYPAGLLLNLNSASSPSSFLLAYIDGTYVTLDKVVSGTITNLIRVLTANVSGATLQVTTTRSGANLLVDVKYNGSTVGTQQTVSDASIVDNTIMGLFSTSSSNTFDNFHVTSNTANTATPTNTGTFTPTFTVTNTFSPTFTLTPTFTFTPTPTFTFTQTSTSTHTPTHTLTPTQLSATEQWVATYEAAVPGNRTIAEENSPLVAVVASLCGLLVLAGLVFTAIYVTNRRRGHG